MMPWFQLPGTHFRSLINSLVGLNKGKLKRLLRRGGRGHSNEGCRHLKTSHVRTLDSCSTNLKPVCSEMAPRAVLGLNLSQGFFVSESAFHWEEGMWSERALFWRRKAKEENQSLGKTADQRWGRRGKLRTLRSPLRAGGYSGGASLGLSGKESACQCRTPGFDLWVRKILWRRAWQPSPVFFLAESHGQNNLVGYSP